MLETGVAYTDITLCARLLNTPGYWICQWKNGTAGVYAYCEYPSFLGYMRPVAFPAIPAAHPHFPYGWDVLPD